MTAPASVVVRTRDSEQTVGRTLSSLREQTVEPEIIVVDSGSTDDTLAMARRWADRVVELPAARFTYGRALNVGAGAARAPVHFALSAHCVPARRDWVERSLSLYERPDVAGTGGATQLPGGEPVVGTFFQDLRHCAANPTWGFSNHASSWRANVWREHPFDESLGACEDKEWALRVLQSGPWVIAFHPDLMVSLSHRWRAGARSNFSRRFREAAAFDRYLDLPPYRLRDLAEEWWRDLPDDHHSAFAHRFLNRVRSAGLVGKYAGHRQGRRRRRSNATVSG